MEVAKINVIGTNATASVTQPITSGMIGATVSIEYDDTWADLNRQVVFSGPLGAVNADGNTVPPEVLRLSGHELKVGIYGYSDDGSRAIPTIWASLGMIQPGADPEGDESAAPTLPVWARMQNQIGNLDDLKTKARESLVAAINELQAAGVDEKEIQRIIGEYLKENEVGGKADLSVNDPNAPGYVANRTHWKEEALIPLDILWDGVTDGRVHVTTYDEYTFYKVSDIILSDDELKKCIVYYGSSVFDLSQAPESSFVVLGSNTASTFGVAVIRNTAESIIPDGFGDPVYAEETGLYFIHNGGSAYISRLYSEIVTMPSVKYHPLEEGFLPSPFQLPTVTTADAGKKLSFVVNDNGEWVQELGVDKIPVFDLTAMGLPAIIPGEQWVTVDAIGFEEFGRALHKGPVWIRLAVNVITSIFNITALGLPFWCTETDSWQITIMGVADIMEPTLRLSVFYYPNTNPPSMHGHCALVQHITV